mmetsp:Transcript_40681/g.63952  ORF Transcript_40681/g.63952 Transcript_40681/m.63952 type:complete len:201 (+) Transcript_40681:948-1550(+)
MLVEVVQLGVEGFHSTKNCQANSTSSNCANVHAFDVKGLSDAIGDVPTSRHGNVMRLHKVSHQSQDGHHHMLCHRDGVAVGHLCHRDAMTAGGVQVDVVGADARGDAQLQVLGFLEALSTHIGRPKGLRDDHVGVWKFLLKDRVRSILGRCDHEVMVFEELVEAQGTGNRSQQLARNEVHFGGAGSCLATRISLDLWECS